MLIHWHQNNIYENVTFSKVLTNVLSSPPVSSVYTKDNTQQEAAQMQL